MVKYYLKKIIQSAGEPQQHCDMTGWIEIANTGAQNCGIYINNEHLDKLMKCGTFVDDRVAPINKIAHIFPYIYDSCIGDHKYKYNVIMEKMDGDLDQIIKNDIFGKTLDRLNLGNEQRVQIELIFKFKNSAKSVTNDDIFKINSNMLITFKLYETVIREFMNDIHSVYNMLYNEITRVNVKLADIGYFYNDRKFDNYGYKLVDHLLMDDYRTPNVPMYNNKYLYIYILDWEGGLSDHDDDFIYELNKGTISSIDAIYFGGNRMAPIFDSVSDDLKKILSKFYIFDTSRYTHNFKDINDVKIYLRSNGIVI